MRVTPDQLYQLAKYLWSRERSFHFNDATFKKAQENPSLWDQDEGLAIPIFAGWASNWRKVDELEESCFLVTLLRTHAPDSLHFVGTRYTALMGIHARTHTSLYYLPKETIILYDNKRLCHLNDCPCAAKLFPYWFDLAQKYMKTEVLAKLIKHLTAEEFKQLGILPG